MWTESRCEIVEALTLVNSCPVIVNTYYESMTDYESMSL